MLIFNFKKRCNFILVSELKTAFKTTKRYRKMPNLIILIVLLMFRANQRKEPIRKRCRALIHSPP